MSKKVFFLGAGFSKALNSQYPLMSQITNEILNDFEKKSINQHYQNEIPTIFKENKNDIESLLTYLSTDLPWKSSKVKALDKALYIDITEKIQEYFYNIELRNQTQFTNYTNLANFIQNNNTTIITLNYDLMVEKLIYSIKPQEYQTANKSFKGFYKAPILDLQQRVNSGVFGFQSQYTDAYGKNLPTILKLHGSINWLWSETNPSDPIYSISGFEKTNFQRDLVPYIIPPVLDKNSFYNNNILKGLWQQAYQEIAGAKEIYIIGFSFPPTDISVKFLFQSALRNNQECDIYVVNNDETENFKKRYKEIFSKKQLAVNEENQNWKYTNKHGFNRFISEHMTNATQTTV